MKKVPAILLQMCVIMYIQCTDICLAKQTWREDNTTIPKASLVDA